tara:strand:+ start:3483 stop:4334 length:852 start_codon:yes stop_codon:yes gene_type:complete
MKLLDGRGISKGLEGTYQKRINELKNKGITPGLGVILIGENVESIKYVNAKRRECEKLGMYFRLIKIGREVNEELIIDEIQILNEDPIIHGILVQLPIPDMLDEKKVLNKIIPEKDVDGFHSKNAGELFLNRGNGYVPCTPLGCIEILDHYGINVKGMNIVVIGCSNIVGLPLSIMLLRKNATVTVCHRYTKDLREHTRKADMVISCCGVPQLVKNDWIKEGVIIIDIGINIVNGKLLGDVDFEDVKDKCSYITPVPGGVGPMTISMLIKQTIESAERVGSKL